MASFMIIKTMMLMFMITLHLSLGMQLVEAESTDVYIVYLGEKQHHDPNLVTKSHHDMLIKVLGSKEAAIESIVYSYRRAFSGFSAKLTEEQARFVAGLPGVLHVTLNRPYSQHTTRSWDFLGLSPQTPGTLLRQAGNNINDVIVGMIDSGVWPERESFNDKGLGPVPSKWRGTCQIGEQWSETNCNKKIIGARFYNKGYIAINGKPATKDFQSPRDFNAHGTHTASTAAGSYVQNVSYHGLGVGLAKGGAPGARLAIYKACWNNELTGGTVCYNSDLLAAFDDAISDGVDIISCSNGPASQFLVGYLDVDNTFSIASFHAFVKGVTVVFSGGNSGPYPQTIVNGEPWAITVAAATTDRSFPTMIRLGNNKTVIGQSLGIPTKQASSFSSLVLPSQVAKSRSVPNLFRCGNGTLSPTLVAGRIVVCFFDEHGPRQQFGEAYSTVFEAGGSGIIFAQHTDDLLFPYLGMSSVQVDYQNGNAIYNYILNNPSSATALLSSPKSVDGRTMAPKVAVFSSRGPNSLSADILKPDIAAPGVSILAAVPNDKNPYYFMSGTSMACPHISGIAALLKAVHPKWSPAAIKSALVTTASKYDAYGEPILAEGGPRKVADAFDYGGGHVNPNKATDPGLVYDATTKDYIQLLCNLGYSGSQIARTLMTNTTICTSIGSVSDINMPSISISNLKKETTVTRTVTNVGPAISTYEAIVKSPPGVNMKVEPSRLVFNRHIKKLSYKVTITPTRHVQGEFTFGSLVWSDGKHWVSIPVVVRIVLDDYYSDIY